MSKQILGWFTCLALSVMLVQPAEGGFKKTGMAGFTFLQIPATARQTALGEAYTAIVDEAAGGLFSNPASIAYMTNASAFISYSNYIVDMTHTAAAFAFKAGNYGTFGISLLYLDIGTLRGSVIDLATDGGYRETGDFDSKGYGIGLTYATQMTDRFAFGATVRYVKEEAAGVTGGDLSVSNIVGEVGTIYYTGLSNLRFGTSVQNFGVDTQYQDDIFEMPIVYRIGAAYDFLDSPGSSTKLTLSVDAIHPVDSDEKVNVGAELWLVDMIALRGGYKFGEDEETVTAGLGLRLDMNQNPIILDVSYEEFGLFDDVFRVSFSASF